MAEIGRIKATKFLARCRNNDEHLSPIKVDYGNTSNTGNNCRAPQATVSSTAALVDDGAVALPVVYQVWVAVRRHMKWLS